MVIVERLHAAVAEAAAHTTIAAMTIGLGYTAVATGDGRLGLSYSMIERTACCTHVRSFRDFDGAPARDLLDYVLSEDTLERSMGLALVNALNEPQALSLPADDTPGGVFIQEFGVRQSTRVAMVGHFPPVARRLREAGAELSILDSDERMGDEASFLRELARWPDVLIVTATTILNGSLEPFLDGVSNEADVMVMGPTTPLLPEAFAGTPVRLLAGMAPVDHERTLAAVRQGGGTPALSKHCRKVYWTRPPAGETAAALDNESRAGGRRR
jgi:uncharacterized protein (DUF4213/DUF364 family)